MAGGVFKNQAFHPNPKCIVFSLVLMLAYWHMPKRNPFLLPLIFVVAYVAMAWYDHLYDCELKLYGAKWGGYLSGPWKPQRRTAPASNDLLKDQEGKYRQKVNLFHILVANPLLIYVGWKGKETNKLLFAPLLGIGLLGVIYHASRIGYPREVANCPITPQNKGQARAEQEQLQTIYVMHLVAIMPLFLYVGWKQNQADERIFPILLALGLVSDAYHGFRLFSPRVSTIQCEKM